MSRSHLIQRAIVGIALVAFLGGGFATATHYWVQQSDYAVLIDDTPIAQVEYQRRLVETRQFLGSSAGGTQLPESTLREAALNQLIERELMLREAHRRGLNVERAEIEAEWQQLLGQTYGGKIERMRQDLYRSYYTEAEFRRELGRRLLLRKLQPVLGKAPVSEAKLKEYYNQHLEQFRLGERIEARHMLFKADAKDARQVAQAKARAEDVLKQLKAGGDFVALAKAHSEDAGSKASGGDLGAFGKGEMVEAFEQAAWKLKPGEYTPAPVRSDYGWHLILRGKTLPAGLKPFEQAKAEIEPLLRDQHQREALAQWIKTQRQAAKILINPALTASAPQAAASASPSAQAQSAASASASASP